MTEVLEVLEPEPVCGLTEAFVSSPKFLTKRVMVPVLIGVGVVV